MGTTDIQDHTAGDPREFTAGHLQEIQENWHYAPVVLGYDTQADPLNLKDATVHGEGTAWILEGATNE